MNNRELLNTYNSSIDMPSDRVFITNNVPVINEKTDLLYEQVGNVVLILTMTFNYKPTPTMP